MAELEPSIVDTLVETADDEPHFRRECSCFRQSRACWLVIEHDALRAELEQEEHGRRGRAARTRSAQPIRQLPSGSAKRP